MRIATVLAAALAATACGDGGEPAKPAARADGPPNIVLIIADDLGHNDVSINGNPMVKTPHIDSIGHNGARFQTGYSGDAVCSTSRAALMTGRNFSRYGFEWLPNLPGFARARDGTYAKEQHPPLMLPQTEPPPPEKNGLPLTEVTLADALKAQGYHNGIVGKWHLGTSPVLAPTERGFDEFVGFPGGAAMFAKSDDPTVKTVLLPWSGIDGYLHANLTTNIWRNGKPEPAKKYMTEELGDEAVGFIDRNKEKPFFLYLAFNAPHNPIQAPMADYNRLSHIKDERARTYYAMIESMDAQIGRVIAKLKADGLFENTILVFTSDNGGALYHHVPTENLPFRGWKTSYFEGGLNVPFLMQWPAKVKPGTILPGVASSLDFFPTFVAAAGGAMPTDREYDGMNILPALTGEAPDSLLDRTFYWRKEDYRAIRHGDWKLQTAKFPNRVWLYDLATDPTERFNVAEKFPEKVKELQALYATQETKYVPPAWGATARSRIDIDGYLEGAGDDAEYIYWAN